MRRDARFVIGVDEVGRGPLAGPVGVGVVCVPVDFDWGHIPGVTDSKKLTPQKREEIAEHAQALRKEGKLFYTVATTSAKVIDRIGIEAAIRRALLRGLKRCVQSVGLSSHAQLFHERVNVLLDGRLRAPTQYTQQQSIVKGDLHEPAIGLASIVAKVHRDRYMVRKSAEPIFAPYAFETHKGYGTNTHRDAIVCHGLSPEHRATYCRNIQVL